MGHVLNSNVSWLEMQYFKEFPEEAMKLSGLIEESIDPLTPVVYHSERTHMTSSRESSNFMNIKKAQSYPYISGDRNVFNLQEDIMEKSQFVKITDDLDKTNEAFDVRYGNDDLHYIQKEHETVILKLREEIKVLRHKTQGLNLNVSVMEDSFKIWADQIFDSYSKIESILSEIAVNLCTTLPENNDENRAMVQNISQLSHGDNADIELTDHPMGRCIIKLGNKKNNKKKCSSVAGSLPLDCASQSLEQVEERILKWQNLLNGVLSKIKLFLCVSAKDVVESTKKSGNQSEIMTSKNVDENARGGKILEKEELNNSRNIRTLNCDFSQHEELDLEDNTYEIKLRDIDKNIQDCHNPYNILNYCHGNSLSTLYRRNVFEDMCYIQYINIIKDYVIKSP
ncbi:unnamed protein product [Gordionus sp. m RMFG-2023]